MVSEKDSLQKVKEILNDLLTLTSDFFMTTNVGNRWEIVAIKCESYSKDPRPTTFTTFLGARLVLTQGSYHILSGTLSYLQAKQVSEKIAWPVHSSFDTMNYYRCLNMLKTFEQPKVCDWGNFNDKIFMQDGATSYYAFIVNKLFLIVRKLSFSRKIFSKVDWSRLPTSLACKKS